MQGIQTLHFMCDFAIRFMFVLVLRVGNRIGWLMCGSQTSLSFTNVSNEIAQQ